MLTVRLKLECSSSSAETQGKLLEVLRAIDGAHEGWPSIEEWQQRLPDWFTSAFAAPMTADEARAWLEHWRQLPATEREAMTKQQWSLPDWLYWMEPEHATWKWKQAEVVNDHQLEVFLEVDEWPVPLGAFEWLARTAGANVSALDG